MQGNIKKLVSLDVGKNMVLTYLICGSNELTAEGLNALLGTSHSNAGSKDIFIRNNPGTADCDRSIAIAKGWKVYD